MFLLDMFNHKLKLPEPARALQGRPDPLPTASHHFVSGNALHPPFPKGMEQAIFAMGCFWGAERLFWETPGVWVTAAGYCGGFTPNPTYQETCTGLTGHAEAVRIAFDPTLVSYDQLLQAFWENHDPTQGMRQGSDVGTQYRSAIFACSPAQLQSAITSRKAYQAAIGKAGINATISTDVREAPAFYPADEYHQQYLAKNPDSHCAVAGIGVVCPGKSAR
ncbi:MAG: peptide-methionine (S)-S-oxide reductase MsrA [Rhizobiaceae bacterium]